MCTRLNKAYKCAKYCGDMYVLAFLYTQRKVHTARNTHKPFRNGPNECLLLGEGDFEDFRSLCTMLLRRNVKKECERATKS